MISQAKTFDLDISLLREKPYEVADKIADFISIDGIPRNINYPIFVNEIIYLYLMKNLRINLKMLMIRF